MSLLLFSDICIADADLYLTVLHLTHYIALLTPHNIHYLDQHVFVELFYVVNKFFQKKKK